MPMSMTQMEAAILLLQAESARQKTVIAEQAVRIKTLETAPVSQIARIADAINQFGAYYSRELPHQSLTNQPAQPWRPV